MARKLGANDQDALARQRREHHRYPWCHPNVTELKEAEETLDRERVLLRTVIDNLPDYIYAKDQQGHFVLNNVAHAKSSVLLAGLAGQERL